MSKVVFSAMRPTGRLHLGHLVGALHNWLELQKDHACIFSIVDWHALMGEYENSKTISENVIEMAIDWLAVGIDPNRSILFVQSDVPEHLELQMILSCITPLGWLERNPTYKEQLREITSRDLQTYGFLGYPVLQAADILLYKANAVPIGEDQLPHLELTREISRRFNSIFKTNYFSDCKPILTPTPRLLGVDGRKMSKSYNNAISLSDGPKEVEAKVRKIGSDPMRQKVTDPGRPEHCSVHSYFEAFAPQEAAAFAESCRKAEKGCFDYKMILVAILNDYLKPIQDKRKELESKRETVKEILAEGRKKAQAIARKTIQEVKEIVF